MKSAYGPIAVAPRPLAAPVSLLTPGQKTAVVIMFFAGEMERSGRIFVADDCEPVTGMTVEALIVMGLAKLGVERTPRAIRQKIIDYRYYVKLTKRGEWFATTLIGIREESLAALPIDNFEDSPTVYAQEPEPEVEAIE